MTDLLCGIFLFFSLGYLFGRLLAKLHKSCMLFWSLMFMPILYNDPQRNLLIASVTFILGMAKGYGLFPKFCEILEEMKVNIELFFAQRNNRVSRKKQHSHSSREEELKRQAKEQKKRDEELRRREQKLNREAEAIRKEKKQAEQERKRQQVKYPSSLQEAFEVLGTRPGLSLGEYKKIWRDEVMKYHPDRTAGLGERLRQQAEEEMKAINRAWEIIRKNIF